MRNLLLGISIIPLYGRLDDFLSVFAVSSFLVVSSSMLGLIRLAFHRRTCGRRFLLYLLS